MTVALASDTGSSSSDKITSNPALSGTGDANAVVTLTQGATVLGTTTANASGAWSFTPSGLAQGAQTIVASETDAAGNTGTASLTFTLDSVAPAVTVALASDTGSSSSDKITSNPALSGTGDANAVVTLTQGATVLGTTTANASGAWSFTPSGLAQGAQTIVASETDAAGNTGTASLTFTLDSVAPAAPIIVSDSVNAHQAVTVAGTAEPNTTVTVYDALTVLGKAITNASGAWTFTSGPLGRGSHPLSATATDVAGNTSAASPTVDPVIAQLSPPTIMSFSPDSGTVGDGITNATTLTLTGAAVINSAVQVYDGSTQIGTAAADGSGAWSFTTGTLANGLHSFTAIDSVGGDVSPASAALSVTVDTVAPPVAIALARDTGASSNDKITSNPTLSGSGDPNAVVTLTEGATVLGATTANGSGAWSFTRAGLGQGTQTIVASETDAAGNTGTASLTFALDTIAPASPVIGQDMLNSNKTVLLSGTAEANSTVSVYDGQSELGTTTANGAGAWSYTTGTLASGFQVLTATATDAAGNTSAAPGTQSQNLSMAKAAFAVGAKAILANSSNSNVAADILAATLLGNYIAASFASTTDSQGVTMVFAEAGNHALLTNPQHG